MALTTLGQGTGTIRYEVWDGIGGTAVADLTGNANFPENPSWDDELALFESPTDRADNFGGRLYGWLHPTETADYTFWLAADDGAEVWLSTTDDPADAVLIVSEDSWGASRDWFDRGQKSDPVALTGGEKYYVEALYKEGGGGDNIAVAWQLNADPDPNATIDPNDIVVIDGQYLSPAPRQLSLLKAKTASPADGAVDVAVETVLEWTPGPTAIMSKVYLSTDETIDESDVIAETQDTSIAPALEIGQTYYWRVDAVDMAGVYEGAVATFSVIPLEAHFPGPADGATMQAIDAQLSWTAGLDALVHNVFFSADQALVEARDPSVQLGQWLSEPTFDPGLLENETTYYWAVDEFLGTATNAGPIWSFTTVFDIPVTDPNLVGWWTLDEIDDGVVLDWSGHGNTGTVMGDPQLVDGAMDFDGVDDYIFTGKSASDLGIGGNSPRTVTSWVYTRSFDNGGIYDVGNRSTGQDFCLRTLGDDNRWRIQYWGGDSDFDLDSKDKWVHFAHVHDGVSTKIYADGVLVVDWEKTIDTPDNNPFQIGVYGWQNDFFDGLIGDVRVYDKALTEAEVVKIAKGIADITGPDDVVVGVPDEVRDGSVAGWPDNEHPALAVDDNTSTKFLHFAGEVSPTGIRIAPAKSLTVVTGLTFTTANDAVERDPITYELYGSLESIDGPYELIAAGDIVDFNQVDAISRFTMNSTAILFENDVAYSYYQVLFPTVRDAAAANSMQIAEIELLGKAPTIAWVSYHAGDDEPHSAAADHGFTQAPDIDYTNLLKDQGYDVTRYVTTKSPDVDYLNTFDLVIVSRTASSGHYSGSGASLWNSITVPLINLNGYTLRSSRLGYTDGTTMVDTTGDVMLAVTDPTHPIFAGIELVDAVMVNPFAEGAVPLTTDPNIISRGISVNNNTLDDEGAVLATIAEVSADTGPVGGLMIAELPAGATMENSSGSPTDVLAGDRLIFLTGSREPSGVTGGQAAALYDLYEDGTQMFLNAVKYMLLLEPIAPPEAVVILSEDFDALAVGDNLHDVDGFEGWWGDAQWAAQVTDAVAYSGTNSLEIVGARDDLVPNWPVVDSGVAIATVMQYVPTGTDGLMYFGPLSSYGASWDDTAWLGTLLSNCTTNAVYVNELDAATRTEATLIRDEWVELKVVMDFDGDACDFYYGDVLLGTLACPSAQGFDIWPDDDVDVIYYDDLLVTSE